MGDSPLTTELGRVLVTGGSGFVGSQVVRALARQGARVRVAVRQPHLAHTMRLLGDVGQIEVVQANIRNPASVSRALEGASAAVNLVGLLYESGRQKFQSIHSMGSRNVAKAAREMGVSTLVQMSAIGADEASEAKYARTKALGEAAVREEFPEAIIIRPSIIFGQGDGFFNLFVDFEGNRHIPTQPASKQGSNGKHTIFARRQKDG